MNQDQELFKNKERSRENAQGSHSGRRSEDKDTGIAGVPFPDEEVIELVDIVRKGDHLPDSDADDLSPLLDQTEATRKAQPFMEGEDEDLDAFSLPFDELTGVDFDSDRDERDGGPPARLETADFDFEAPEDFPEQAGEDLAGIPEEDLDEVMAGLVDEVEGEPPKPGPPEVEQPSVSPERLEAIITGAVTQAVERVVRETVAEVAERVIKEAIESLKHSLESTAE